MNKIYLDKVNSTHLYLKNYIRENGYAQPTAIITQNQTNGIGSRDNQWIGKDGNLFFSFVLNTSLLPQDLPYQSTSIYFSYILKDILVKYGSKVCFKWPNDFYIQDKKIGGTITKVNSNLIYCGIGLNLFFVSNEFGYLDIDIEIDEMLNQYFQVLEQYPSWKQIISKFEIEFDQQNGFRTNKILLNNTVLQSDGSLLINGKKVFSLR
jgi:BirA family biotin operon repressor/biotin-[acetyl-CoA-carboxylase] ligase